MNAHALPQLKRPLLLLVDDLAANLHVLVAALKAEFRLKTATSGPSALALLARESELPTLVILDVKMPGMSGIELLRRLRKDPRTTDIPVILLSADASEQSELAGLNLGADDYLVKPVSPSILAVRVRNLIERNADRRQLRLAAHVFQHSGEAIMITDRDNHIIAVNDAFTKLTGYSHDEAMGRDPKFLSSGRGTKEEFSAMWAFIQAKGIWQGELWDRRKDGSVYPKMMTVSVVRDRTGAIEYHLANFVDVTHYKESQNRIEHIAHHDALTGLPNRLHLQVYLEQNVLITQHSGEQLAVMFLDLDRFKTINDTLGHSVGDQLLIEAARRLKASVREYDLVARLGGDEFVVVLRGHDAASAVGTVATKIRRQLYQPFELGEHTLRTAASIGIALCPDNGNDLGELMKCADTAMYAAKSDGGNGFRFFTPEMDAKAHENLEMENLLHEALERGQFELYYQPQISLPEHRVSGAEVLLRWLHPERGFISPALFIPLSEATNQICDIGAWVLEQACHQASQWLQQGLPLPRLAVNVSARQLQREDFHLSVERVLKESGYPPERLELEVTETAVATSPEKAARQLRNLRTFGIQIALDDFGTGYSSLGQLKKMPLDRLKIDGTFVRDISSGSGHGDGAIAAATIAMGHSLGFQVVAEGVETEMQLAFLTTHGCDEVQGYYFAKPMPSVEFEAFLRARGLG
jgi:diguanylate cyclase (GGDEF)-like protein/PAS domain S-box-containing protein